MLKKIYLLVFLSLVFSCKKSTKNKGKSTTPDSVIKLDKKDSPKNLEKPIKPDSIITNTEKKQTSNKPKYEIAYSKASNLICRDSPSTDGKAIHRFPYATEVKIIKTTDIKFSVEDDDKTINGYWTEVLIDNSGKTGYVFDGFLESNLTYNFDLIKIAKFTPPIFKPTKDYEGIITKGIHSTYNEKLQKTGTITINKNKVIEIISATLFERAETKKELDYKYSCSWAKHVKINYNDNEIIVFGRYVEKILSEEELEFNNEIIYIITSENFCTKTSTLTEELSGCDCRNNLFISSNTNNYSYIYAKNENKNNLILDLMDSEYGGSDFTDLMVRKDTIYGKIICDYQEGTGEFKVKIFSDNNKWKYFTYDKKRDYNDNDY